MFGNPENVTSSQVGKPLPPEPLVELLMVRTVSTSVLHPWTSPTARAIPTEMTAPNTSGRCLLQQVRLLLPCVHCRYRFGTRPLPGASSLHGTQYSSS